MIRGVRGDSERDLEAGFANAVQLMSEQKMNKIVIAAGNQFSCSDNSATMKDAPSCAPMS